MTDDRSRPMSASDYAERGILSNWDTDPPAARPKPQDGTPTIDLLDLECRLGSCRFAVVRHAHNSTQTVVAWEVAASRPEPGADLAGLLHDAVHENESVACRPGHAEWFQRHAAYLAARGVTVSLGSTMGHANWCRIGADHVGPCDDLAALPASPEDGLRDAARNAAAYLDSIGRYKAAHHADALRAALKEPTDD